MKITARQLNFTYRVVDAISLIIAILMWQYNFQGAQFDYVIGLVIPTLLMVIARGKTPHNNFPPLALWCMVFAFLNWPFGLEVVASHFWLIIIAGILSLIIKPVNDFITGSLISFWVIYFITFIESGATVSLTELKLFAFGPSGLFFIMNEYWWVCALAGFACSLLTAYLFTRKIKDRYMVITGLLSLPFLFGVFVLIGYINGLYKSVHIYLTAISKHVKPEASSVGTNDQPAVRIYLFRKSYDDIRAVLKDAFQSQMSVAKKLRNNISVDLRFYGWVTNIYLTIISVSKVVTMLTFGMIWLAALTILHLFVVLAASLPMLVLFAAAWLLDSGSRRLHKVDTVCPSCHHHSKLPVYICPGCGEQHTNLVPGAYGILKRKCHCGHKLPTTSLNGRTELEAQCPNCHTPLYGKESTPICIPIIGGPSVGKTSFMISATKGLIEDISPKQGWAIRFMNDFDQKNFETVATNLKNGYLPAKTVNQDLTAFNFFISNQKWPTEKMVYFYDPAGEAFDEMNTLKNHGFYEYNHGNIFVIDPFSIPGIAQEYEARNEYFQTVNPSEASLEEIFDRLMIHFQEMYGIKAHQKIEKPMAFVINKVDAFDLDQRIGKKAAQTYMEQHPEVTKAEDAIHYLCRKLLADAGMNSFLRKVDEKFKNCRFFASSSINATDSTSVVNPVTWVLSEYDKDLKVS